jgi:hypothetical protein
MDTDRRPSDLPAWAVSLIIAALALVLIVAVAGIGALVNLMTRAEPVPEPPIAVPATPPPEPYIRLTPSHGAPGTTVIVTGYEWRHSDTVNLYFNDPGNEHIARALLGATAVRDDGGFVVAINIPDFAPWSELEALLVEAESPMTGERASASFLITPIGIATPVPPTPTPVPPTPIIPTPTPFIPTPVPPTPIPPTPFIPTPTPFIPTPTPFIPTPTPAPVVTEWQGEYFANPNLVGPPTLVRHDLDINYNWGLESPAPGVPADSFSVRWTRNASFQEGNYRFFALVDGGVRIYVNDQLVVTVDELPPSPPREVHGDIHLLAGVHTLRVEYVNTSGTALIRVWWEPLPGFLAWRGEYFDNRHLIGSPALVRDDPEIRFNWGTGAPAPGLPVDNFSVRWTRTLHFDEGTYVFYAVVDDGIRLYVDNVLIIDRWITGPHQASGVHYLPAGQHALRVEYYEEFGEAYIHLWWERIGSLT